MTDDEDFLADLKTRFEYEFSRLCNRYIQEAANHHPELTGQRYLDWLRQAEMTLSESFKGWQKP